MMVLAIDTSSRTAGAAISNSSETLGEYSVYVHDNLTHSEILLPMIERLFFFTGYTLNDMDYIACVNGPGSFTGLRIGAATAKGLAKGAGKPLVPVSTLDALAYNTGVCPHKTIVMPMLNARRQQVYTAIYAYEEASLTRLSEYAALPIDEALSQLSVINKSLDKYPVVFIGDGADAYKESIIDACGANGFRPVFALSNVNRQRPSYAGLCAHKMLEGGYKPSEDFDLVYIRKPQAIRNIMRNPQKSFQ